MDNIQIQDFLESFTNCFDVPAYLVQKSKIVCYYPCNPILEQLVSDILDRFIPSIQKADYYIDHNNFFWGMVRLQKDSFVLIGPISCIAISKFDADKITRNLKNAKELSGFFQTLPCYTAEKMLQFMKHIYLFIFREALDLDIFLHYAEPISDFSVDKIHSRITFDKREIAQCHDSYSFENAYLNILKKGNTEELKAFFNNLPSFTVGTVAQNSLRQIKNIFIAATTTATRASIEGGVPPVEAYNLSDIYIYQMEKMTDPDKIYHLQYQMILDFCERVKIHKVPDDVSVPMFTAAIYIASHVNEPLTVSDVAEFMKLSRPYLSKKFHEEVGISISEYIMKCKLEEAKKLLKNSDKPIGEISNYLYFSSQSYFQNVFKKKYGISPKDYRKKNREQ